MKKTILLSFIALFSVCTQLFSVNYYIRLSTNTSHWSNITPDATHVIVNYTAGADFGALVNGYAASSVVWVAKGTYTIATTIQLKTNVTLFGGFSGSEFATDALSSRATSDLDANGMTEPWEFTNSTEIVSTNTTPTFSAFIFYSSSAGAIVDGVTVKGIVVTSSTSTLPQVILSSYAATGCAFKNSIVKDCTVSSSGTAKVNGAVSIGNGTIENCLIQNNTSSYTGTAANVNTFGGGLSVIGGSSTTNYSSPKAIGCIIRGNKSNNPITAGACRAGGAYILANNATSYPKMINCLVYNNETNGQGGGVYIEGNTSEAINCTVANNKSGLDGGGVFFCYSGIFNNSIVWGNLQFSTTPHDIYFGGTSNANYSTDYLAYSFKAKAAAQTYPALVNTKILASSNTTDGTGTVAPKFVNPTSFAGIPSATDGGVQQLAMTTANFKLGVGSPCLDYTNNTLLNNLSITTDLLGLTRFVNITADMGAYELPYYNTTITFNSNGAVTGYTSGAVTSNPEGKNDLAYTIIPNAGYKITSVLYNSVDVTSQLVDGVYTAPALTQNSTLYVTFDLGTGMLELKSKINFYAINNGIQINGLTIGDNVLIYGIAGNLISSQKTTNSTVVVTLSQGVYLVHIGNSTNKLIVK